MFVLVTFLPVSVFKLLYSIPTGNVYTSTQEMQTKVKVVQDESRLTYGLR